MSGSLIDRAADPVVLLASWLRDAAAAGDLRDPDAMSLATIDPDGRTSNRIVLCKRVDIDRGALVFFTNYESRKGCALAHDPRAAATFYWDSLGRQARVEGVVERLGHGESDAYFASRPREARIGAWASKQSQPLGSRAELERSVERVRQRFLGSDVPRPASWGGYLLIAEWIELWVAGEHRLHERVQWARPLVVDAAGVRATGDWASTLLWP